MRDFVPGVYDNWADAVAQVNDYLAMCISPLVVTKKLYNFSKRASVLSRVAHRSDLGFGRSWARHSSLIR